MSQAALKTAKVIPLRPAPAPLDLGDGGGDRRGRERLLRFLALSLALHAVVMMVANRPLPEPLIEPPPLRVRLVEQPPVVPEMKPVPPPPVPAVVRPRPQPQPRPELRPEPVPMPLPAPAPVAEPAPAPPPPVLTAPQGSGTPTVTAPPEPPKPVPVTPPLYSAAYLSNPPPDYPAVARRRGLEGVVLLSVLVSEAGLPKEIRLAKSSGAAVLDEAALDAVKGWKFVPARQGDQAVAAWVEVPIRFRLEGR